MAPPGTPNPPDMRARCSANSAPCRRRPLFAPASRPDILSEYRGAAGRACVATAFERISGKGCARPSRDCLSLIPKGDTIACYPFDRRGVVRLQQLGDGTQPHHCCADNTSLEEETLDHSRRHSLLLDRHVELRVLREQHALVDLAIDEQRRRATREKPELTQWTLRRRRRYHDDNPNEMWSSNPYRGSPCESPTEYFSPRL